jgi:hypothetical protein
MVDQLLARCPTASEVAAINSDFKLTFAADPTKGQLVCTAAAGSANLTLLQRRIYQTLQVAKRLSFSRPLPWTAKSLYDWLRGAINGLRFRSDIPPSYCCDPANTIDLRVAGNMYYALTDRWVDPTLGGGPMDALVLISPGRATKKATRIPAANSQTIAELGAWSVRYNLLIWFANNSDPAFLTDRSLSSF